MNEIDFAKASGLTLFRVNCVEDFVNILKNLYDCNVYAEILKRRAKINIIDKDIKIIIWYNEHECYCYYIYLYDRLIHTNINNCSLTYACSLMVDTLRDFILCYS